MNESLNPKLKWFSFSCGTYNVATWATSERAAKKALRPNYPLIDSKHQKRYGKTALVTIVV